MKSIKSDGKASILQLEFCMLCIVGYKMVLNARTFVRLTLKVCHSAKKKERACTKFCFTQYNLVLHKLACIIH